MVEKEAAQACARFADLEGKPSLCKTIKLIGDPSLKQLKPSCTCDVPDSTDSTDWT